MEELINRLRRMRKFQTETTWLAYEKVLELRTWESLDNEVSEQLKEARNNFIDEAGVLKGIMLALDEAERYAEEVSHVQEPA